MIRSKLSLSKKLANSMILANDLCQPSVEWVRTLNAMALCRSDFTYGFYNNDFFKINLGRLPMD